MGFIRSIFSSPKRIAQFSFVFLAILAVPITLTLVKEQQDQRSQASGVSCATLNCGAQGLACLSDGSGDPYCGVDPWAPVNHEGDSSGSPGIPCSGPSYGGCPGGQTCLPDSTGSYSCQYPPEYDTQGLPAIGSTGCNNLNPCSPEYECTSVPGGYTQCILRDTCVMEKNCFSQSGASCVNNQCTITRSPGCPDGQFLSAVSCSTTLQTHCCPAGKFFCPSTGTCTDQTVAACACIGDQTPVGGTNDTPDDQNNNTTPKTPPCQSYGDVNLDGKVDASDSSAVLQIIAGLGSYTQNQRKWADVDGQSGVGVGDSLAIQRYISGLDSTFAVCATLDPTDTPTVTSTPSPTPTTSKTARVCDFDYDEDVDSDDYTVWLNELNNDIGLNSDCDDDGQITIFDYILWLQQFRATASQ